MVMDQFLWRREDLHQEIWDEAGGMHALGCPFKVYQANPLR